MYIHTYSNKYIGFKKKMECDVINQYVCMYSNKVSGLSTVF